MTGLQWGLIGASDIAATTVIPALRNLSDRIVGVLSSSTERGRAYADANGIDWATTDLEALLRHKDLEAAGLEVHGTEGSIVATGVMTQERTGRVFLRTGAGEREVEPPDRRNLYEVTLEAFAAAVRGAGRPIVDGTDGPRALAVALAVKEAAETGRTVPVERRWG